MGINVAFDIVDNTDDVEPTIAAINKAVSDSKSLN
jgi:hypothetical protein